MNTLLLSLIFLVEVIVAIELTRLNDKLDKK